MSENQIPASMNPAFANHITDVAILRWPTTLLEDDGSVEKDLPTEMWIETQNIRVAGSGILETFDFLYPEGGESKPDGVKPMTWVFRLKVHGGNYAQIANTLRYNMWLTLHDEPKNSDDQTVIIQDMTEEHKKRIEEHYVFDRFANL